MRKFLASAMALLLVGCGASQLEPQPDLTSMVQTESGRVVPIALNGVLSWRDIPYAQPPVGDLRWRAPRPFKAPDLDIAARPGVACVQQASDSGGVPGDGIVGTEDCLYLDIKAPQKKASEPRPVMVWIHGGGNTSGYKGYYNFDELIRREDVVVVTFNYRLGPLGWFTHPHLQGADSNDPLDNSSNFGLLDIIQALKWVQNNIQAFGGDAQNVTIFGESAGGHNVFAMLASPLAEGLFHKAIAQSGYVKSATPEQAFNANLADSSMRRSTWHITQQLGVDPMADAATLRGLDAHAIYEAFYELDGEGDVPLTTADGIVIPREDFGAALANPAYAKNVPVIAGANRDEVTLWLGMHRYFVEASYPFTKLLPPRLSIKDPEVYKEWIRVRSAAWKVRGVDQVLDSLSAAGYSDLYAYRFDWDDQESSFFADFPSIIGAAHGVDIAFVTGKFKYGPVSSYVYPDTQERQEMMTTMMRAWASFARAGTPDLTIEWPQYTPSNRDFVHLDVGDALRIASDNDTQSSLLSYVETLLPLSRQEQCLLGWELLTKVGQPDYQQYESWAHCRGVDAALAQTKINQALREKYGSTSVL